MLDKRDVSQSFRTNLDLLIVQSGQSRSAFAEAVGIDRSALSQILTGHSTRLPRAETLMRIASRFGVSIDWLLGLSADHGPGGLFASAVSIEEVEPGDDQPLLARWHGEASGMKIRYVPARIPDLLRTDAVIAFEQARLSARPETERNVAQVALERIDRPDSDMEICMAEDVLRALVDGSGAFAELPARERRAQLETMADMLDTRYPRLRLYLYEGRRTFSAPFTVFGPKRAAIYLGDAYLVFTTREMIDGLTRRFDELVRRARVHAHETAACCRSYAGRVH